MKDGGRCWPWPSGMRARKETEQSIGKDKEAGLAQRGKASGGVCETAVRKKAVGVSR